MSRLGSLNFQESYIKNTAWETRLNSDTRNMELVVVQSNHLKIFDTVSTDDIMVFLGKLSSLRHIGFSVFRQSLQEKPLCMHIVQKQKSPYSHFVQTYRHRHGSSVLSSLRYSIRL